MQALVYIKPFDDSGVYQSNWIDITKYVQKLSKISVDTDSAEYQIGVYRQSNVSIELNNREGLFADVGSPQTLFHYKRADTLVKITYILASTVDEPQCGSAICGETFLSDEVEVFKGLLSDENFREAADKESAAFSVLGLEALFDRTLVNVDDLSVGMTTKNTLYTILNQTAITDILTVVLANIDPDVDQTTDVIVWMENITVKEALNKILVATNSVLFISEDVVYIQPREASTDVMATFYGQASVLGAENILSINNMNNGFQRMFNLMTWRDDTPAYQDNTSVLKYGVRSREMDLDLYTDNTKQTNILTALVNEFKDPKAELELKTVVDYNILSLQLLDKVELDYPTVAVPTPGFPLPICGVAICGEAVLPRMIWSFTIPAGTQFKILKKEFDLEKMEATLKLRAI